MALRTNEIFEGDRAIEAPKEIDRFENCFFQDFSLTGAILTGTVFVNCSFTDCHVEQVRFCECEFFDCSFTECKFTDCSFSVCEFQRSLFSSCHLAGNFLPALSCTKFPGTILESNIFSETIEDTDFREASLKKNDFMAAYPQGFIIPPIEVQLVPDIGKQILNEVRSRGLKSLNMCNWHSDCGTAHCIAGWVAVLHPQGRIIEEMFSTEISGYILFPEAAKYFFEDEEVALKFLETLDSPN